MTKSNQQADKKTGLVTVKQATGFLGISERALFSLTHPRGPIAVTRIGRSVKYRTDVLDAYIEKQTEGEVA